MAAAVAPAEAAVTDLDTAIRRCRSLEEWSEAATAHPDALRGASPDRHLEERCTDESAGLSSYRLCALLRAGHATPTPKPTARPLLLPGDLDQLPLDGSGAFEDAAVHLFEIIVGDLGQHRGRQELGVGRSKQRRGFGDRFRALVRGFLGVHAQSLGCSQYTTRHSARIHGDGGRIVAKTTAVE